MIYIATIENLNFEYLIIYQLYQNIPKIKINILEVAHSGYFSYNPIKYTVC